MELRIAFMVMEDGSRAIVRGSPVAVTAVFDHATKVAKGGSIPCQVYGEVWSASHEDALWRVFVDNCHRNNLGEMAEQKYWIWRRKAVGIWRLFNRAATCIFVADSSEMIVQI